MGLYCSFSVSQHAMNRTASAHPSPIPLVRHAVGVSDAVLFDGSSQDVTSPEAVGTTTTTIRTTTITQPHLVCPAAFETRAKSQEAATWFRDALCSKEAQTERIVKPISDTLYDQAVHAERDRFVIAVDHFSAG